MAEDDGARMPSRLAWLAIVLVLPHRNGMTAYGTALEEARDIEIARALIEGGADVTYRWGMRDHAIVSSSRRR